MEELFNNLIAKLQDRDPLAELLSLKDIVVKYHDQFLFLLGNSTTMLINT